MSLTGQFVDGGYQESPREAVECGLHSGFPLCCVAWYAGPWRWLCARGRERFGYLFRLFIRDAYHLWRDGTEEEHVGYVQCPLCKARNVQGEEVFDCPESCYVWEVRYLLGLDGAEELFA